MGEILRIKKHHGNYVILDKTFIKDSRLSWKAKGVLGYLLSCPDGWDVNVNDLTHQSTDGKCAIYSALKELTEYGYYKKMAIRDEKSRIIRWESTVSELPMDEFYEDEHIENSNSNITVDNEDVKNKNQDIKNNKCTAVTKKKSSQSKEVVVCDEKIIANNKDVICNTKAAVDNEKITHNNETAVNIKKIYNKEITDKNKKITHHNEAKVALEKSTYNHNEDNTTDKELVVCDDKPEKVSADFPYSENQKVGKTEAENREDNKEQNIAKNDGSNIKKYCASSDARSSFEKFFEKIWQLYPRKRGKAKISVKQKKHLCELGQELFRTIERYKAELKIESWKQAQNGDTFFNKGYIDYLDNNYIPLTQKQPSKVLKNAFHNFEQRTYDWDAMERLFLTTSI